MQVIDKASGYFYGGLSGESDDVMEMMSDAVGADLQFDQYLFMSILGGGAEDHFPIDDHIDDIDDRFAFG